MKFSTEKQHEMDFTKYSYDFDHISTLIFLGIGSKCMSELLSLMQLDGAVMGEITQRLFDDGMISYHVDKIQIFSITKKGMLWLQLQVFDVQRVKDALSLENL